MLCSQRCRRKVSLEDRCRLDATATVEFRTAESQERRRCWCNCRGRRSSTPSSFVMHCRRLSRSSPRRGRSNVSRTAPNPSTLERHIQSSRRSKERCDWETHKPKRQQLNMLLQTYFVNGLFVGECGFFGSSNNNQHEIVHQRCGTIGKSTLVPVARWPSMTNNQKFLAVYFNNKQWQKKSHDKNTDHHVKFPRPI